MKTADCPKMPEHMKYQRVQKPVRDLTDEEIDHWIGVMIPFLAKGAQVPSTQYGRRVAVQSFLRR